MSGKGWPGEKQRHSMAARGVISSKDQYSGTYEAHGLGRGDTYEGERVRINRDLTASRFFDRRKKEPFKSTRVYFIKKKYMDGSFLAFWTDSPWGRVHDQDRGWVVIKPTKSGQGVIVDRIQTYDFGPTGEDYRGFLVRNKEEHGGYKESYDEWKMTEGY